MKTEEIGCEAEMNRGFLQILVLTVLERSMYGYMMLKFFSKAGYTVEENTLYPLLRRLEKYGWIKSEWNVSEDRPKKYYLVTANGRIARAKLLTIWNQQNQILNLLMEGKKHV